MTNRDLDYKAMTMTASPSTVFRAILSNAPESDRNRMYLVRQIQALWGIPLEKAMFVGGWREFQGSYSDEDVDSAFSSLRGGAST
jgi:hypothetical protein